MPIRIKFSDIDFGDVRYIIHDPEQMPHCIVGLIIRPGNAVKFILSFMGEICEVYDFETAAEPNPQFKIEDSEDV